MKERLKERVKMEGYRRKVLFLCDLKTYERYTHVIRIP